MSAMQFRSWATTHTGAKRPHNEDAIVDRPDLGLWAVADGAGGHEAGEVASGMIRASLEAIPTDLSAAELLAQVRLSVGTTHADLQEMARQRGVGVRMASTVVVLMARGNHFACLWAGDSRAYLLRDGTMQQVTRDHSLVQDMLDAGAITEEEAANHPRRNVITRAVGVDLDELELEKVSGRLEPGDRFLLCSDGLCNALPEDLLRDLLAGDTTVPPAQALIAQALAHNASDNISAVVVEVI